MKQSTAGSRFALIAEEGANGKRFPLHGSEADASEGIWALTAPIMYQYVQSLQQFSIISACYSWAGGKVGGEVAVTLAPDPDMLLDAYGVAKLRTCDFHRSRSAPMLQPSPETQKKKRRVASDQRNVGAATGAQGTAAELKAGRRTHHNANRPASARVPAGRRPVRLTVPFFLPTLR